MAAHALLSASSAYRWTVCTKAPHLEAAFPDSSSWAATEGTIAHAIGEFCLLNQKHPDEATEHEVPEIAILREHHGEDTKAFEEDLADMRRHVAEYVDYVMAIPGARFIEQRVDFSHLVPGGFGTSDAITLNGRTVTIVDLKYGKGKKVFADGPQTKLYALGALHDYGFIFDGVETIELHIFQPRLDHIDVHEMTVTELTQFGEWIKGRAELAFSNKGDFVAGTHCDFCRARFTCKARAETNLRIATEEFGEPCPSGDTLTIEEIAGLLPRLDQIAKWCGEVQEYALSKALEGVRLPGYKLVEGRSTRKWIDELAVAEAMRAEGLSNEQIYNMKLVGLTEAEKLLGKKSEVFALAVKAPGKPTLVPVSDKRPELAQATVEEDFAE